MLAALVLAILSVSFAHQAGAAPVCPQGVAAADSQWQVDVAAPGAAEATSGEKLRIEWRAAPAGEPSCIAPTYLVVALPERVRLSGQGFFVLGPGERAPFAIGFGRDRVRAVVPLHLANVRSGVLELIPYLTGDLVADWAVVAPEQHREIAGGRISARIATGRPRLLVQDIFRPEAPQASIESNSGAFRLDVFDGHFAVTDRVTNALVFAAEGVEAGFSPSSRFLQFFGPDRSEFRVADLFAETVVLAWRPDAAGLRGTRVMALEWSPGDSFLLVGFEAESTIGFAHMLADRGFYRGAFACGACSPWTETEFRLEIENARAVAVDDFKGAEEFGLLSRLPESHSILSKAGTGMRAVAPSSPARPGDARWSLNGERRSSLNDYAPANGATDPATVVSHRVIAVAEGAGAPAAAGFIDRGARPLAGTERLDLASRFSRRLADVGLGYSPALPLVEESFAVEELDDPRQILPGAAAARRGLLDAERALQVDAIARRWMATHDPCDGSWGEVRTWSWTFGDEFRQLVQYVCVLGTGRFPYGLIGRIRSRDGSIDGSVVAFEPGNDNARADQPVFPVEGEVRIERIDAERVALIGARGEILLYDMEEGRAVASIAGLTELDNLLDAGLTPDRRHVVQTWRDGRFHVHAVADGRDVLTGFFVDDEIVVHDENFEFDATPEGARHVHLKFPGVRHVYSLDQFGRAMTSPDLVERRLRGEAPPPRRLRYDTPPQAAIRWERTEGGGVAIAVEAESASGLTGLTLYEDGVLRRTQRLGGPRFDGRILHRPAPGARWLAVSVSDAGGLSSTPQTIALGAAAGPQRGARLFVVAVGTDHYDDRRIGPLDFAVRDASAFAAALGAAGSPYYSGVETWTLADSGALAAELPAVLAQLRERAGSGDTVFVHVAGHGIVGGDGRLYLPDRATRLDRVEETAITWDAIAAGLAAIDARVVVFLDTCHSGAAGTGTNDDAVDSLLAGRDAPFAVVAASKGRQPSFEGSALGGGVFTATIVDMIGSGRAAADLDANGVIELAELYGALKARVVRSTGGGQTPWIVRSSFVGEVPLF